MRVTVLVAADLYQNKINLELGFPNYPSIADLQRLVESTFAVESSALRPAGHPFVPFKVIRFQIFDDRLQQWVDLVSSNQLTDYCQIYAFQRDNSAEVQKQIPPARLPTAAGSRPASPPRQASPYRASPAPRNASPPRHGTMSMNYSGLNTSSIAPQTPMSTAAPVVQPTPQTPSGYNPVASPVRPVPTSVVAAPPTAPPGKTFPENATVESKSRAVFDELDVNNNRVVELEEFRRAFRVLNIDISGATVSDLFTRADRDRDGVVSLAEFQQWTIHYPTLLDSLYFRSKEFWEDHRKKQQIEAQNHILEDSRSKEVQAQQQHSDVKNDLAAQETKLSQQESELQGRMARERDCRQESLDAKKESEKAQFERGERERDLAGGRERERQKHVVVVEAQRGTEGAQRRVATQEGELGRAQEKERQLEALLAEARRETERQLKNVQMTNDELTQQRDREQQALNEYAEMQRDVQRLQDVVSNADLELARRMERERETEQILSESQRETARAAHRRDEEERELQLQRERELHHARLAQDATRAVEDASRALSSQEAEYADYLSRRQQIEAQELPLLEQEIRLREARFTLEEKETQLKTEAMSFSTVSGRTPVRSGAGAYTPVDTSVVSTAPPMSANASYTSPAPAAATPQYRTVSPRRSPMRQ